MIIQLEEARIRLRQIKKDIDDDLSQALKIDEIREKIQQLEALTYEAGFWNDPKKSSVTLQEIKQLKNKVDAYEALKAKVENTYSLAELAIEDNDESFTDEILKELEEIESEQQTQRLSALLTGEYDANNAILSFHPGAGGTEAQDWAQMLYRMYTRWGETHGYNVKLIDWLDGEEAGIKSATIMIEGLNAYGFLKSENGVHRLVRVSPFDSSGRRHTSFASVEVMPEFTDDGSIEIKEEDLEITAHRSSGAGGQHINKTDSAIRITHLPTNIVVTCQSQRSQIQNREQAMIMLKSKLYQLMLEKQASELNEIKGEQKAIEWGSQIRSYVLHPYSMVKDNRSGYESNNPKAILDGDLDECIYAYLKSMVKEDD